MWSVVLAFVERGLYGRVPTRTRLLGVGNKILPSGPQSTSAGSEIR